MILLLVLMLTLLIVGVGGWAADSRDERYSLWPLHRTGSSAPPTSRR